MDLNTLLAGPIVRRVDKDRAFFWIATSEPAVVVAEVYCATPGGTNERERIGGGPAESLRLGERLHVHLVCATPDENEWPVDELLAYDLRLVLESDDGPPRRLEDFGLLDGPNRITYGNLSLPAFFVARNGPSFNVMHGSCRLLHGRGEDALAVADEILGDTAKNTDERPSALFLTGDQIYADDVAAPFIGHIRELATELVGAWDDSSVPQIGRLSSIPVAERGHIVREKACFTSDHCDDHLMSFGEYAAMYVCTWNHENWPADFPTSSELSQDGAGGSNQTGANMIRSRRTFAGQRQALERARVALPSVRRALANIPTYMIFDDHDVTDDWNLTEKWRKKVQESPTGRRVVANGLAAFFGFQGWGNDPDSYDETIKNAVADHLTSNEENRPNTGSTFDSVLWGWDRWSFRTPTQQQVICLDTRTQRAFDSPEGAARLIRRSELDRVAKLARDGGHREGDPLVMVSAVPVFGFELQERRQKFLMDKVGPYEIDFEAWHSNLRGLVDFMQMVIEELRPSYVGLLSGDVHYGVNARAAFSIGEREMPFAQLVSSGQKHAGVAAKSAINLLGRLLKPRHERLGWDKPPEAGRLEFVKDKVVNRPVNTDEWSGVSPVFLAPRDVRLLNIESLPDYKECRVYVRPIEPLSSLLVGENNIGLVSLRQGEVTHRIFSKDVEGTAVKTATIKPSGSLFD